MGLFDSTPAPAVIRGQALRFAKDLSRKDASLGKVLKRAEKISAFLTGTPEHEGELVNTVLSHIENDLLPKVEDEAVQGTVMSVLSHIAEGYGLTRGADAPDMPPISFDDVALMEATRASGRTILNAQHGLVNTLRERLEKLADQHDLDSTVPLRTVREVLFRELSELEQELVEQGAQE